MAYYWSSNIFIIFEVAKHILLQTILYTVVICYPHTLSKKLTSTKHDVLCFEIFGKNI